MTETPIEQRLRNGLAAAAEQLPPPAHSPGQQNRPGSRWRRGWAGMGIAAAVAILAGGATLVWTLADDDSDDPAVRTAGQADEGETSPDETTPTTVEPTVTTIPIEEIRETNGRVPGEAVLVGDEIRLYDASGQQTGAVSIAPLQDGREATSDLAGGWLVCGSDGQARYPDGFDPEDFPDEDISPGFPDQLIWFPANSEPEVLDDWTFCEGMRVVDSPQGPILISSSSSSPPIGDGRMEATVLATGETYDLPVTGSLNWAATSSHFLSVGPDGPLLSDLVTGEHLEMADLDIDEFADVELAPDASAIAVAGGAVSGPIDLTVYDTQTGETLYSESFQTSAEGLELSFDGDTVAVGNFYEGNGPVTVVDLESGERHAIDVHGVLL